MNADGSLPPFLDDLIRQLIRRGLPLGVDDCEALRRALTAGFGWTSDRHLQELCVALWAKSSGEADVIRAVFARVNAPKWNVADRAPERADGPHRPMPRATSPEQRLAEATGDPEVEVTPFPAAVTEIRKAGLPLAPPRTGTTDASLVFFPQYPVTEREVAQTWRRLRRAIRQGPPVELDIAATLAEYGKRAVVTAPVLVPVRRNTARLVILMDRQGSMTPYHSYMDYVCQAIVKAGRLDALTVAYFRNTAGRSGDHGLLLELPDSFQLTLDPIVSRVSPLPDGYLYQNSDLTMPMALADVIGHITPTTGIVIISDGGAGRRRFHTARLLDTIALVKTLRQARAPIAWLNPVPPQRWPRTTAEQIARHVPMFPLTRDGMHRAVDVLRGRPSFVERAI